MAFPARREPLPAERSHWPWLALLPFGTGSWAPIYAGVRARSVAWVSLGALWSVVTLAGWIAAGATDHGDNTFAGLLIILGWVGAIATSFVIRGEYERRMGSPLTIATETAQQRLADRRRALALARANPELAAEAGIGRPDLGTGADAGLVDVNNAPVTALLGLPGVDGDVATRIAEARAAAGGFKSVEDLGETLDLPGDVVEGLRERCVFLPRSHGSG